TSGSGVKIGIVNPTRDAAGLDGLLAMAAVAATAGANATETATAVLRGLAANSSAVRAEILTRFPHAGDQAPLASALTAAPPTGAPGTFAEASPVPPGAAIDTVLKGWLAVSLPSRMLAVLDVSGSMLNPVPTAGNATRMQVTTEAARKGLSLFDDKWAVGLWI